MLNIGMHKLQSAMEYLMTYGWAILIIAVAAAVLYELHIFSPAPASQCILQAGFSCAGIFLSQNGILTVKVVQSTQTPVVITAYGCNSNRTISALVMNELPSNGVTVLIGETYTFSTPCYDNGARFSGAAGQDYSGYLILNYTQQYSGLKHTLYGSIVVKIS